MIENMGIAASLALETLGILAEFYPIAMKV